MEDKLRDSKHNSVLSNLRFEEKNKKYVMEAIQKPHKRKYISYLSKMAYVGVAIASLLLVIIGGSYISPAVAKVAGTIPYISQFAKQEENKMALYELIHKISRENSYELRDLNVDVEKKTIGLSIHGTEDEINKKRDDIIKTFNVALSDEKFGKYDISVKRFIESPVEKQVPQLTEEEEKYIQQSQELEKKVIEALKKNNYKTAFPVDVRINKMEKFMYVAVPKTEKRMDELKSLLRSLSKDYGEFRMRITRIDMKARNQELKWDSLGVIHTIGSALMADKSLKVRTYSYSFHPYPLQLKIKTNIKSTDPDAAALGDKIEKEIDDYIKLDEKNKAIRNDPYELTVLSKDKKKIN